MAICKSCGKSLNMLNKGTDDLCNACISSGHIEKNSAHPRKPEIDAILLTTECYANVSVVKRIEIVTAECAFGMNLFKDLFAGVRDVVGGRSNAVQKTMRDARKTVLYELKKEAHEVGANAVIGVDLDYVELSSAGSMVMLVASGTAVVVTDST